MFLYKFRHLEIIYRHVRSMWNLGVDPWSKSYCLGVTWQDESSKLFCILSLGILILPYQNWLFLMCDIVFVSATIFTVQISPTFCEQYTYQCRLNIFGAVYRANMETSDQDLHCLPFWLHLLAALIYGKTTLFKFQDNYTFIFSCPNVVCFIFTVQDAAFHRVCMSLVCSTFNHNPPGRLMRPSFPFRYRGYLRIILPPRYSWALSIGSVAKAIKLSLMMLWSQIWNTK